MTNKSLLKDLVLRHFIQLFIGILFYFYYVGYVTYLLSNVEIYSNLLFEPCLPDVISNGVAGFFLLSVIVGFLVCIYEFVRFVKRRFSKAIGFILIFLGWLIVIKLILIVFIMSVVELFTFLLFTIFFIVIILDEKVIKKVNRRIFFVVCFILLSLFLLFYPNIVYDFLLRFRLNGCETEKSYGAVLTSIALELPNEEKTAVGYSNKMAVVKFDDRKSTCISFFDNQIIIVKNQDVIRIKIPLYKDRILERYKKRLKK